MKTAAFDDRFGGYQMFCCVSSKPHIRISTPPAGRSLPFFGAVKPCISARRTSLSSGVLPPVHWRETASAFRFQPLSVNLVPLRDFSRFFRIRPQSIPSGGGWWRIIRCAASRYTMPAPQPGRRRTS